MKKMFFFLLLINSAYFFWQVRSQDANARLAVNSVNAPPLVLLSEISQATPVPSSESEIVQDEVLAVPQVAESEPILESDNSSSEQVKKWCGVLGQFADQANAAKASALLTEQGYKSAVVIEEAEVVGGYLVYLPPFDSREAAVKKLRELKAQSIDSFVIAEGERINGISLGVFSKEASAQKLKTELKLKGYTPQIAQNMKVSERYSVSIGGQNPVQEGTLATLKGIEQGGLNLQEQVCQE